MCYFGAFRVSELVHCPKTGARFLWGDIHAVQEDGRVSYLFLEQYISKTRRTGPAIEITICRTDGPTCPTSRFLEYRELLPLSYREKGKPVFVHPDGSAVTYAQMLTATQRHLHTMGYTGRHFGTHSFRIGFVTQAGAIGIDGSVIKLLGRWNSECYMNYIRKGHRWCNQAASAMA